MKVFKLVDTDLKSATAHMLKNPDLILQYSTEEWTIPVCGYIFAFEHEDVAVHYGSGLVGTIEVWEAEARITRKKVKDIPYPGYIQNLNTLCAFWKSLDLDIFRDRGACQSLPYGTVLCKSLILKKRIQFV